MTDYVRELLAGIDHSMSGDLDPMQVQYYRGVIVAVVATLMQFGGLTLGQACTKILLDVVHSNEDWNNLYECVPDSWLKEFGMPDRQQRKSAGMLAEIKPTNAHVEVTLAAINFVKRRSSFSDLKSALRRHGWM